MAGRQPAGVRPHQHADSSRRIAPQASRIASSRCRSVASEGDLPQPQRRGGRTRRRETPRCRRNRDLPRHSRPITERHHVAVLDISAAAAFHVERVDALPQFSLLQQRSRPTPNPTAATILRPFGNDELHGLPFLTCWVNVICPPSSGRSLRKTSRLSPSIQKTRHGFRTYISRRRIASFFFVFLLPGHITMGQIMRSIARRSPRPIKLVIKRVLYSGTQRYCPVCECSARKFRKFGVVPRDDAWCPFCGSLERHRLLWRFLQEKTEFFQCRSGTRMLHIAPESCFEARFRQQIGPGYLTADLMEPADVRMDITDIQYPNDSFDIIYCSHVLEHVPDDRKAMREFHRVLKSDGWAVFMVPITIDQTVEDPSITDPRERLRSFGQHDQCARYGRDFVDRLKEAGFHVNVTAARDFLSDDEVVRIAVRNALTGEVFHCSKDTD